MPYIDAHGNRLEKRSPWRLSIVSEIVWGVFNFISFFVMTLFYSPAELQRKPKPGRKNNFGGGSAGGGNHGGGGGGGGGGGDGGGPKPGGLGPRRIGRVGGGAGGGAAAGSGLHVWPPRPLNLRQVRLLSSLTTARSCRRPSGGG